MRLLYLCVLIGERPARQIGGIPIQDTPKQMVGLTTLQDAKEIWIIIQFLQDLPPVKSLPHF